MPVAEGAMGMTKSRLMPYLRGLGTDVPTAETERKRLSGRNGSQSNRGAVDDVARCMEQCCGDCPYTDTNVSLVHHQSFLDAPDNAPQCSSHEAAISSYGSRIGHCPGGAWRAHSAARR